MNKSTRNTNVVKAYGNKVKANILHLLNIYGKLTTIEISDKLVKSKTTILRNIEELIELKIVEFEEEDGLPGKYPRRKYHLAKGDFSVRGQDFRGFIDTNPEYILDYNQYRQGMYALANNITTSCINYLQRLRIEFENKIDDPSEILDLQKDNLGSIGFKYLTKNELQTKSENQSDPNLLENEEDNKKPYLKMTMVLPIERIVEMETRKDWKKDGNLWFYD